MYNISLTTKGFKVSLAAAGAQGPRGYSAYEIAVLEGYTGTELEFATQLTTIHYASERAAEAVIVFNAASGAAIASEASRLQSQASAGTSALAAANALASQTASASSASSSSASASSASSSASSAASSASASAASAANALASQTSASASAVLANTHRQASEAASAISTAASVTAVSAKDLAEMAAQSVVSAANMYATTALGIAATAEGEYFTVPSQGGDIFLSLYRKVSGAAVLINTNYSSTKVDSLLNTLRDESALSAISQAVGLVSIQAILAPTVSFK